MDAERAVAVGELAYGDEEAEVVAEPLVALVVGSNRGDMDILAGRLGSGVGSTAGAPVLRTRGIAQASETAARRWRLLADVGQCLARGVKDPRGAIAEMATLLVPAGAEGLLLYVLGGDDVPPIVEVAHVDAGPALELRSRISSLVAEAGEGTVLGLPTADPEHAAEVETAAGLLLASVGLDAVASALWVGGQARGLVALVAGGPDRSTAADREFARSLADRLSLGLEQARMFRQTQRALAARDRAVGIVSHDLRNPLSTIQVCATALLDPEPPPVEGVRRMAEIILQCAGWMQQIAQDLLDRASLDAGRLALHREATSPAGVIAAAEMMFAPMAADQSQTLVVEGEADLPRIDADPRRLIQVLSNLLSNALKFTAQGGRVVLSARAAEEETGEARGADGARPGVRFTVSDTGPGIAPQDLAHVCDWFWQSPSGKGTGAGLGLAIAHGLIEAHRRRLHVESVPGEGSTFWFTMPAVSS